jgi:hypothetical protein
MEVAVHSERLANLQSFSLLRSGDNLYIGDLLMAQCTGVSAKNIGFLAFAAKAVKF